MTTGWQRPVLFTLSAAIAAHLAWQTGYLFLLPFALILPLLLGLARTRPEVLLATGGYFLTYWYPAIHGAKGFFGDRTIGPGILFWLGGAVICALPFLVSAFVLGRYSRHALIGAVVLHALSPLGLGSPIIAAGALFPAAHLFGIWMVIWICFMLIFGIQAKWTHYASLVCIALSALIFNLGHHPPESLPGWEAIHTSFAKSGDIMAPWMRLQFVITTSMGAPNGEVVLFPEGIGLASWEASSRDFIAPQLGFMESHHQTAIFGVPFDSEFPRLLDNGLVAEGFERASYRQRIPIPVGMWGAGYAAHPFDNGDITIGGHRAAVLLCYEQLLVFPAIQSFWNHPDVLLASSNLNWAHGTSIEKAELVCVKSWARLYGVPYLMAVNR